MDYNYTVNLNKSGEAGIALNFAPIISTVVLTWSEKTPNPSEPARAPCVASSKAAKESGSRQHDIVSIQNCSVNGELPCG